MSARRMLLLALAALLARPAAAQTTSTVTLTAPSCCPANQSHCSSDCTKFGQPACTAGDTVTIQWALSAPLATGQSLRIGTATKQDCTDVSAVQTISNVTGQTGTLPTPLSYQTLAGLVTSTSDAGGVCGGSSTAANPTSVYVCATTDASGTTATYHALQLQFAMTAPPAPGQPTAAAGDQHVKLSWPAGGSGVNNYKVAASTVDNQFDASKTIAVSSNTADVDRLPDSGTPLQDGTKYFFAVFAKDDFGNVSTSPSPSVSATPIPIDDFYAHYRNEGGTDTGGRGCSAAGDAGWLAALCVSLFLIWRRSRRGAGAALVFLLAAASGARAQEAALHIPPAHAMVALKFDKYIPRIDSQPGLTGTPYADVFGTRRPWRALLEIDWEAAHPFGSILLGGTAGYWQNIGKGIVRSDQSKSDDTALLDVIPLTAVASYRFDVLASRYRLLPFIPYAQVGLGGAFWASFNGAGKVRSAPNGGRGSGWSLGWTRALGVALDLGAIDRELAFEAYRDAGLHRTAIFAEYQWSNFDGFKNGRSLILSDKGLRAGLSLEF